MQVANPCQRFLFRLKAAAAKVGCEGIGMANHG